MSVVQPGDWVTSIDLKDALTQLLLIISPSCGRLPGPPLPVQGATFQPFPVSQGIYPICGHTVAPLEAEGVRVLSYLDDCLVCAPSRAQVEWDTSHLLAHVTKLDRRVNWAKRCLVPTQQAAYLGLLLDSVAKGLFGRALLRRHPPSPPPLQEGQEAAIFPIAPATRQADIRLDHHSIGAY